MPLIVSQSLSSSDPLDQSPTKAVGISLPIVRDSTGYFRQTYTTNSAIRNDLINLILTQVGERPLNPEFGTNLYSLVFEQQDAGLEARVDDIIRRSIRRWMSFVEVHSVIVDRESGEPDIYSMKVVINYSVPNVVGLSDLALLVEA
jgi:phage baseplate assembly protein W